MEEAIIKALITAAVPSLVAGLIGLWNNRTAKRNSAKQSILQMIMEDEFGFEVFHRLPTNYHNIMAEYDTYHKNGGNGEITRRVDDYIKWRASIQDEIDAALED